MLAPSLVAQDPRPTGLWKAERIKRGDTTVVRTLSGSVWGDKVKLIEELRIGTREGDGPDSFGAIMGFTMFPDGVMAVFDQSVPALRLFSPDGKHLRTLGREGAGPGEYRNASLGLAVDRNGVLLMYDPRNARLNRWKEDGTILPSFRVPGRLYADHAFQLDPAGNIYILITTEQIEAGKEWKFGLARFSPAGELRDTLLPPAIAGEIQPNASYFSPQKIWFVDRQGEAVTAYSGSYAITRAAPGGSALRVERVAPRVALAPRERANYQEAVDNRGRTLVRNAGQSAPVPPIKPFFRELFTDLDARLWVRLHLAGEEYDPPPPKSQGGEPAPPPIRWREPKVVWDVFQKDGSYLGQLELPRRTQVFEARGNLLWTLQFGEDDENYIVRYRIVR